MANAGVELLQIGLAQIGNGTNAIQVGTNIGKQVAAEINQGQRTVLEYLLSPVQKVVQEAGRER